MATHSPTTPPSAESLRDIPPRDPNARRFKGRGPEAFANARAFMDVMRGRPRKDTKAAGSKTRSLRLPDAAWDELERRAAELGTNVHSLLRQLVGEYLYTESRSVPARRAEPARRTVVKVQRGRGPVRKAAKR